MAWESDDTSIARVSRKGKITAVGKGTCHVYAYAQNGTAARIKVTVK
ncbi:MAG: Ig-like domain-containing protein [Lachnospiraceae bacterium]|nr:Ig-like domain-containing protein [Lachnospiraceae bacterium]